MTRSKNLFRQMAISKLRFGQMTIFTQYDSENDNFPKFEFGQMQLLTVESDHKNTVKQLWIL